MEWLRPVIKQACIIVIFSFILGMAINIFHPRGYVMVGASRLKQEKIVRISALEAKIKIDAGNAIVADSRSSAEFDGGHIPGAVNIPSEPPSVMMRAIEENIPLINGDRELVLYCSADSCGSADVLAAEISTLGYSRHIYIIDRGVTEWVGAGYPLSASR